MSSNEICFENVKNYDLLPKHVKSVSNFVENDNVYGFTVTLKGGAIRNFFVHCQLPDDFEELKKLKNFYQKLKK